MRNTDKLDPNFQYHSFLSFGRGNVGAASIGSQDESRPLDLITFLAIAQSAEIDFVPITWPRGLPEIGIGATAKVRESFINLQKSLAFKIVEGAEWIERIDASQKPAEIKTRFEELISEIDVLTHPAVREHPNIIQLLGTCWDILPSGRVWPVLLFEKAPFGDLWSFTATEAGRKMGIKTRIKLCSDIATAIRDLHQNNIIHGDIKPQNVLIFKDNSNIYVAKVADFGYSKTIKGSNGIAIGRTWPWEAPEWEERHIFTPCDAKKTDAYSFGMLCLWLILSMSLDNPNVMIEKFEGLSEQSNDTCAAAKSLIESHVSLQTFEKEKLNKLFSLTLINDPKRRSFDFDQFLNCLITDRSSTSRIHSNATVSEVISPIFSVSKSAFQLFQADIRVRVYTTKALEEHMHGVQNNREVRHYIFQLALCYKIGFGVGRNDKYIEYLSQSGLGDLDLQKEIERIRSAHPRNKTIQDLLSGGYLGFPSFYDMATKKEELEKIICDSRRELVDAQFNIEIVIMLRSRLAFALSDLGRWKEAEELYVQVMEMRKEVLGEEHPDTLTSMANLASTYSNRGRWEEAQELEIQVMETRKKVLGQEHPDTLVSMANLASTLWNQGQWKEAEELELQVVETRKKVLGQEHPSTLLSISNMASTYRNQGRWKEAIELDVQVMEMRKRLSGREHPDTLNCMANLASSYRNQGRWKEAEELEVQVMETRKEVLGQEHPFTLTSMVNLASTYSDQGRWKEAEKLETQVVEMRKKMLGQEHPSTLNSIANLASTFWDQGRWKEAEELFVQVMETRKKVLGQGHPDTLTSVANLAATYSNQGRWKEAEELMVQVMETRKRMLGQEHPDTLVSMANLASTLRNQGQWEEAEELELQVKETSLKVLGEDHPSTLTSMSNLASSYSNQGRWKEAEELTVQVMEARKRVLGQDHPSTMISMSNLALTYRSQGQLEKAEELDVQVVEMALRVLGQEHPNTLTSMANLASTYSNQGRWKEAEELNVLVAEMFQKLLGEEHPDTLTSMANLASTYSNQGRWKEAEKLNVQVMEMRGKVLGQEHPSMLTSMANLAFTLKCQGRSDEAVALMVKCIQLRKAKLGFDHPDTLSSIETLNEWEAE